MERNEYNVTKKMLKTIRTITESKNPKNILKEQKDDDMYGHLSRKDSETKTKDDVLVINNVDVKLLSTDEQDMKIDEKQKEAISGLIDNFRQQVSQIVDFEPGFTINMTQIRLDGVLRDEEVSFVFIAGEDSGVYVNSDMLKLEQSVADIFEKLVKFQETFETSMEPLITQRSNN
jgi:hypothetical protein